MELFEIYSSYHYSIFIEGNKYHKSPKTEVAFDRLKNSYKTIKKVNNPYIDTPELISNEYAGLYIPDIFKEIENSKLKNFNIEKSYRHCFGIISTNDEEPQDIILSFDPLQGKYIKTLPLHDTQQVLVDNDQEMKIKLRLCLTHDLLMELLSFGEKLKVIEPKTLADQIKQVHENAYRQY